MTKISNTRCDYGKITWLLSPPRIHMRTEAADRIQRNQNERETQLHVYTHVLSPAIDVIVG